MFTFIHAADIHLDSPLRGLSRYETAPVEAIRNACRRAFENLIDVAIEERVGFILLAGDLYNGDWKDYNTGIFLSKQMGRLAKHNIQAFVVWGNHDAENRMTKSLDTPKNMKVFSSKAAETYVLNDLGVAIHGRSFPNQHVEENLAAGFNKARDGFFNIGLLHTSLDGREGHGRYAPCTLDDLRAKGYQYWALGHIHKQEIVEQEPYVVFSGCIQGRHIGESGAKGVVVVEVDDGLVKGIKSVPLDVLRWSFCQIDVTGINDKHTLLERIRRAIEDARTSADDRPLAMRIRLEGVTEMAGALAAYPEKLTHTIKALGAEIAEDDLWIERVENTMVQRVIHHSLGSNNDNTLSNLREEIMSTANTFDSVAGLEEKLTALRKKLPAQSLSNDTSANLDDPETISRIIDEAKRMLIGRLLTMGDKQ